MKFFEFLKQNFILSEPDIEEQVLDQMGNPTLKSKMFPYKLYDSRTQIYHMKDGQTQGFILHSNTIVGCSDDVYKQLTNFFANDIPQNGILEFLLLASDDKSNVITRWSSTSVQEEEIYKEIEKMRANFFENYNETTSNNFRIRDYKLYISYSKQNATEREILTFKDILTSTLQINQMYSQNVEPQKLIKLVKELMAIESVNVDDELGEDEYNPNIPIDEQFIDPSLKIAITRRGVHVGENTVRCYNVSKYPSDFSIGAMPNLLGDSLYDNMNIPAKFAILYTVSNEIPNGVQEAEKNKGESLIKFAATSFMARFNKDITEEANEWNAALDDFKKGSKLLKTSMSVLLVAKTKKIHKAEQNLFGLWRKYEFALKLLEGVALPALLSFCPFLGIKLKNLKNKLNLTHTAISTEPNALLPIHAEPKNLGDGGQILVGRKGQLMTWNFFESPDNYNVVVTGMTGSGKSVFMQDLIMNQVRAGVRVFIIDIGRSFEKLCKLLSGEFIAFNLSCNVSLNPFASIGNGEFNSDIKSMLKLVIERMASPTEGTSDFEGSLIAKAIDEVCQQQDASIDKLAEILNASDDQRARDIAIKLYQYTSKGTYGRFFDSKNTTRFQNQFTVIEFEEIREIKDLTSVTIQMLIIQIMQQIYLGDRTQRFCIVADEAWKSILENAAQLGQGLAKTIRKYNGSFIIGTQSPNDFYNSSKDKEAKEGIVSSCSWKVFLKQNPALESMQKMGLTKTQIDIINTIDTKKGEYSEVLIVKGQDEYFTARLMLDKFSATLYSSTPAIFAKVNKYVKEGMSIKDAINLVNKEAA